MKHMPFALPFLPSPPLRLVPPDNHAGADEKENVDISWMAILMCDQIALFLVSILSAGILWFPLSLLLSIKRLEKKKSSALRHLPCRLIPIPHSTSFLLKCLPFLFDFPPLFRYSSALV
jgi:hypothetical protein